MNRWKILFLQKKLFPKVDRNIQKKSAAGSEKIFFSPGRFPETQHFFIFATVHRFLKIGEIIAFKRDFAWVCLELKNRVIIYEHRKRYDKRVFVSFWLQVKLLYLSILGANFIKSSHSSSETGRANHIDRYPYEQQTLSIHFPQFRALKSLRQDLPEVKYSWIYLFFKFILWGTSLQWTLYITDLPTPRPSYEFFPKHKHLQTNISLTP